MNPSAVKVFTMSGSSPSLLMTNRLYGLGRGVSGRWVAA